MLPVQFNPASRAPLRVLCVGAHADDIEIGCGGTLMQLLAANRRAVVKWVVLATNAQREREAKASARRILRGVEHDIQIGSLRDGYLPYQGEAVKDVFEGLKPFAPDLIFTHARQDLHQDHRLASELTWNTFRSHAILEYEIPKYDADLGQPNVFMPLSAATRRRKLQLLMSAFPSQLRRSWFTEGTFDAMLRLRGVECAAPSGFAEAFHGRKLILSSELTRRG